jgi:tRNA A58 N-methylase Trm61
MDGVDEQILLAASIIERGVGKGELFFYLLSFSDSGLVILTNKRQINRRKSI